MNEDPPEVLQRVQEGLALVEVVAKEVARTMGRIDDLDEAIACGRVGLLKAARRYDPAINPSFPAFAKDYVRGATLEGLRKLCALPRRAHQVLSADASERPRGPGVQRDPARLREKHLAGVATAQAQGLFARLGLDTQGEFVAVSAKTAPDVAFQRNEERVLLERCIAELPPEEASVVRLYQQGVPIQRIAQQLGITRVTAQSTYDRAVQRLQKRLAKRR
jgi:RNA polymerase sigma factor for flagellar operon FliA